MKSTTFFLCLLISLSAFCQNELYITGADQTQLNVREFGTGSPVILLSGGPGLNSDYMSPIWDTLSENYRCIVPDQRGTGKSILSIIDSASLSMDSYVQDLESLRTHFNIQRVTLVGHSWGGMLAMEYTSKYPQRVEKLILIGSGGPTVKFANYFNDNRLMRLHKEDMEEAEMLKSQNESPFKAMWPGYFFDRDKGLLSKKDTDFSSLFGQMGVGNISANNYFATGNERVALLKGYSGDVDIIQGRQDPMGESTVYEIMQILPQSNIHFIERCGHFPWLENDKQIETFYSLLFNSLE